MDRDSLKLPPNNGERGESQGSLIENGCGVQKRSFGKMR
jgi:hypothetical protein